MHNFFGLCSLYFSLPFFVFFKPVNIHLGVLEERLLVPYVQLEEFKSSDLQSMSHTVLGPS